MIRESFNDSWEFRPRVSPFAELGGAPALYRPVTLPHDAMIGQERVAPDGQAAGGGAGAYFPGGAFEYRKTFSVPEEHRGRRIFIEFEGVYRDAMVYINGDYTGQCPYGYSLFRVDADRFLRFGQDNEIRVEARAHRDSRWYSGAGIYRDTWLLTGGLVRIGPDGIRVTTPDIDTERAVVEVAARVENDSTAIGTVGIVTEISDAAGRVVTSDRSQVSLLPGEPATARQWLYVRGQALWSPDSPALYAARVTLTDGDDKTGAETVTFGIRSLRLDPERGLRINGETVKLRGACVHHDNGVLGAATFPRAEERRVQILKDAGFNAIRMSHNPMSKAMLDACDRLGMLVMDEAFDMWTSAKSDFDYSLDFPQWWERDIESMVAKDVNHPSVILYSIGNEISETGSPAGAAWGRRLAEKVRALDPTRYVTNAVNGMVAVLADLAAMRAEFETVYEPGELPAVAYRNGAETGRHALRSAHGPVLLRAEADRQLVCADGSDLVFVTLTLTDSAGTGCTGSDRPVRTEVTGPAILLGFGSACPSTEERFDATERRTNDGRALAILRPTGPGKVRLIASAPECESAELVVTAQ